MTERSVSIIIPAYNSEDTIERAIQSIYEQRYNSFEIVIIDDGSTDNSPALCDNLAASDKRIIVFHNKTSQGVSSARNKGLELAKGDYITFLDSDDELAPNFFNSAFSENDWDVWVGNTVTKCEGKYRNKNMPQFEFQGIGKDLTEREICSGYNCLCCISAKIIKKFAIGDIRFYEALSFGEDGLFFFEVILKQNIKCVFRNIDVYIYKLGKNGLASKFDEQRIKSMVYLHHWLVEYGESRCFSVDGYYWNQIVDGRILEELYFIENRIIRSKEISKNEKKRLLDILLQDPIIKESINRAPSIAYKYPKLWIVKDYYSAITKKLFSIGNATS